MLQALESFGFQKASAENGVLYLSNMKRHSMLGMYVDDLIFAASTDEDIADVKTYLSGTFKI